MGEGTLEKGTERRRREWSEVWSDGGTLRALRRIRLSVSMAFFSLSR
jgi:hypothetical protein